MAGTKKHGPENYISNGMGIPAHDYIVNTYDGNNNILNATYKLGGSTGEIVGVLEMTYDGNNNVLTIERTV